MPALGTERAATYSPPYPEVGATGEGRGLAFRGQT